MPGKLRRRGYESEEPQTLQPWVIGSVQIEIHAGHRKMRDNVVVESADAMNRKGHHDVRFNTQYLIANRLLECPWIEFLQSAVRQAT